MGYLQAGAELLDAFPSKKVEATISEVIAYDDLDSSLTTAASPEEARKLAAKGPEKMKYQRTIANREVFVYCGELDAADENGNRQFVASYCFDKLPEHFPLKYNVQLENGASVIFSTQKEAAEAAFAEAAKQLS